MKKGSIGRAQQQQYQQQGWPDKQPVPWHFVDTDTQTDGHRNIGYFILSVQTE